MLHFQNTEQFSRDFFYFLFLSRPSRAATSTCSRSRGRKVPSRRWRCRPSYLPDATLYPILLRPRQLILTATKTKRHAARTPDAVVDGGLSFKSLFRLGARLARVRGMDFSRVYAQAIIHFCTRGSTAGKITEHGPCRRSDRT